MNVNLKDVINEVKSKCTSMPDRFHELVKMADSDWTSNDREFVIKVLSANLLQPEVLRVLSSSKSSRALLPELYSRLLSSREKLWNSAERVEEVAAALAGGLPLLCPALMAAPVLEFFRECCCTPFEWIATLGSSPAAGITAEQARRAERVLMTAETLFSSRVVGPQLLKMWGCAPVIGLLTRLQKNGGNEESEECKVLTGLALRVLAACWNVPVSKIVSAEARGTLEKLAINGEIATGINNATVFLNTKESDNNNDDDDDDEWSKAVFQMKTTPDIIAQDKEIIDLESSSSSPPSQQQQQHHHPKTTIVLADPKPSATIDTNGCCTTYADISARYVDVQGVLLPNNNNNTNNNNISRINNNSNNNEENTFVETATTARNLHGLALAVSQGAPVLLEGPTGSGKTALVEHLAALTGNAGHGRLVRVHLGDQTDAKTLLGSYVTTETPSEFRWQPGVLAQAVGRGLWILVEDIDIAPMDVLSVLIPLLETRRLFVPGRGEVIDAAAGFQLFATRTLVAGARSAASSQGGKLLDSLWSKVVVEPLSSDELRRILAVRFPQVANVATKFVETFERICGCFANKASFLHSNTHSNSSSSNGDGNSKTIVSDNGYIPPSALSRTPSARDVIKWAHRVATFCGDRAVVATVGAPVSSDMLDVIFLEAMDCFCAAVSHHRARRLLADVIAEVWGIFPDKVTCLCDLRKPEVHSESPTTFTVGRVTLPKKGSRTAAAAITGIPPPPQQQQQQPFAHTGNTLRLLEQIALCVSRNEPVLLVGETGTGKTTVVQHLAAQMGRTLVVQNLSQQTDSADLIGGFKPVELRLLCTPIKERFETLFVKTFSRRSNTEFLASLNTAFAQQDWPKFVSLVQRTLALVDKRLAAEAEATTATTTTITADGAPKRKPMGPGLRAGWEKLRGVVSRFDVQQREQKVRNSFAFSFVEGTLVKAVRNGDWVLLDEINLATTETLESLSGLLEGGSLTLNEIGDIEPVPRHKDFRIFACMNPPTDVGKKDLPPGLRNRFTELYVEEMEAVADLELVVGEYLRGPAARRQTVEAVVRFYLDAKRLAQTTLVDGARQKTHYSLRTLTRALQCTRALGEQFTPERALYEGISMSFLTQLNHESLALMTQLIRRDIAPKSMQKEVSSEPKDLWRMCGIDDSRTSGDFILTPSTRRYVTAIARAVASGRHPVLLQGPTSTGKTSIVRFLAQCARRKFVRINNHEHTDVQEYLGAYVGDESGRLVFREGPLVEAVRNGYWVVLDELNLAPSEVLEALNRLLDANRELFVPETQETIRAHPDFMLFATQNPPGLYGGRKALSRAFRNRFVEIHVEEYPNNELDYILQRRCSLAETRSKLLVNAMRELQQNRAITQVFAGRNAFITLRDLFRWAGRKPVDNGKKTDYDDKAYLAADGYCLLVERLRRPEDKRFVQEIIEKNLKSKVDPDRDIYSAPSLAPYMAAAAAKPVPGVGKVVWTKSMRRLFALVERCLRHKEPVLLVGETGCGKTTVCQLWAEALGLHLRTLNCHQHTETADFLGGLRPVRGKEHVAVELVASLRKYLTAVGVDISSVSGDSSSSVNDANNAELKELIALYEKYTVENKEEEEDEENSRTVITVDDEDDKEEEEEEKKKNTKIKELKADVDKGLREYHALFAWVDGPLIEAMRDGDMFLIDEISLAEDAVLERLNSVLEPSRELFLAEKGGGGDGDGDTKTIKAHENFRIVATMNPGGDFGKRELSPAMRNRFTEIWVPAFDPREDLAHIIDERLARPALAGFTEPLLEFVEFFASKHTGRSAVSVRDLLSWVQFMNVCAAERRILSPWRAYVHGACMILLDGIGVGSGLPEALAVGVRRELLDKIISQVPPDSPDRAAIAAEFAAGAPPPEVTFCADGGLTIGSFHVAPGPHPRPDAVRYELRSPTTALNALRVLRAMEITGRAVLLEGSPGVGKTSLIAALAAATGHRLTRINLSEQTDIGDLMGADLPVEGGGGSSNSDGDSDGNSVNNGGFSWRDGAFLAALKAGDWVLLDELNLASQSVLEGLNSVLDHRGEAFIPELGRSFKCPKEFRVFAAQNPTQQGGGRKGLPKSFLSRFSQVYVDKLQDDDLLMVATSLFPTVPPGLLKEMIAFNAAVVEESTSPTSSFARKGSPWEFNLRDIFRWCELMTAPPRCCCSGSGSDADGCEVPAADPSLFAELVYSHRLRTAGDRARLRELYNATMTTPLPPAERPHFRISDEWVQVGYATVPRRAALPRSQAGGVELLQSLLSPLQDVLKCVEMGWLCIVVGPSASGKTSLVRLAAELTGNVLHEFSMNSSVDTTELLGGFEQVDLARHTRKLTARFARLTDTVCGALLLRCGDNSCTEDQKEAREALLAVQTAWGTFCTHTKFVEQEAQNAEFGSEAKKSAGKGFNKVQATALTTLLSKVEAIFDNKLITYEGLPPNCTPESLRCALAELAQVESKSESGCFEWIDGLLIQAMEAGDWLLIDNVNFCNPTVLDRLNSVLEPGGVLAVNERGMEADGQVKSVRPHPNFRIFFTMDPHNGEVSRAMRNRGIEICLLEHEVDSRDTLTLLNAAGIPGGEIPRAMIAFHVAAARGGALTGYNASRLSLRDVLQWARLAVDQAQRGVPAIRALFFAMEQVYIRPCCTGPNNSNINNTTTNSNTTTAGVRGGVRALMENFVRFFGCWEQPADVFQPAFRELGIWPARASGDLWRRNAAAGALILDAAPAESAFEATPAGASDWPALASPITFYKTMLHSGDNNATAARKKGAKMLVAVRSKHYMELSLRHLIETSTAEDADTRLAWLLSYAGNAGTTVDAAVHAMRALRESELLQKGSQAFAETCRALGITCDTLQHQQQQLPFALRTARCFRDLLVRLAGCDRAKMSLVRRCDALSRRVSLYVRIAMDDYAEAQACEAAEQLLGTSGGTTALAPLQRSILYAKNRIFLESIKSDWECHGWSFLAALTACLKSWLLAPESADAQKDAEDLRAVEEVLFAKEALVGTLCGSEHALTLDDVVWNWDSLFKALDHAGPLLPSNDALGYTHKKLCASLAALRVSPSRLWRTVRPRPYRHASLWDVQRNVTALGHEMELTSYASILPAFVTRAARPQFRKTLMDAAANFRWSMLLSKTSTAQEGADEEEGKRTVSEAVRLISEKMEEAMKKQQTTYEGEGEEEEEGRDNDEDVDRMDEAEESEQLVDDEGMPIVKSVFTSLWKVHNDQAGVSSLVDYSTVMREQEVLAYTLRGLLAAASSESGSTTEITRSVFDAHQRLVKQGADNIARSPLDYVPHILILWALSAAAEAAKESGQQQQQQNQQNQLQLMRQAKQLPGLETEALLNWHRRLWENTFDNTYFGARIVSRARVSCQTGPARIYQGLKSAIAYSLLSSWSTAPVQLYADKRSQIARVKAFFADEERLMFSSRALAELAAFVASFTQTVDSLAAGNSNVDVQCQCQRQRRAEIIELIFEGKRSAAGVAEELVAIFDEQLQGVVSATPSLEDVCKLLRRALQEVPAYVRGEKRTLGAAWALLGLAKVSLLVPPPTDPAAKSALKLRAAEEREGLTREEISVLRDIETVTTGNTTTEEIAALEGTVAAIEEQKRTLAAKAVERPKGNNNNSSGGGGIALSYANVHAEIARIVSMSFTVSRVLELIETLDNAPVTAAAAATSVSHEELSERQRALLKEEVWQETTGKALRALLDKYAEYPDVVQPLCLAAYETKYGLRLMSSVLAAANSASLLAMRNATVALSTYPRAFTDAEAAAAIRAVISPAVVSALHDAGVKTPWRVFSAALSMGTTYVAATAPPASSSEGLAATTGTGVEISPTMMDALNSVFDAYTKAWEKCEEKRRKREEEKAKEFETKTIVTEFIDEEKERQEEEEEIASLFPDYSSQFADLAPVKKSKKSGGDEIEVEEDDDDSDEEDYGFMKKNKNEEEAEKKKKKKSNGKKEEEISDKALKDVGTYVPTQEVETLRSAHLALFGGKKNKTKDEDERRKKALLDQYRAAAILVASISSTPEELDTKLTAIHTAVADLVIEQMDTRAASLNSAKRRNSGIAAVDIYKESCIEETVQAYEPLLRLERRLAELLREWPEHATLQSMMKIVRRILLMPLHAPLMKFVIGLECLLSQAQIWEQCAAKHVSLAGEMDTVSRLVARWRRLELMSWPLVLKTRERQHATSSGIWWFHLYSALIQARPATRDAVTATVKTVSDFLQTSSLGQFESRVEMVGAFAHHLALLYLRKDSSSSSNANGNVNGNGSVAKTLQTLARSVASLHALYAQFVEPCNERIANMRQKVEEELKEFIRLSSWERLEYYSLKEAAAKSHKKLTKLSKKYDKILRGPISDVLASIPHLSPDVIPDLIAIEKEEEEKDDTKEEKDGENSKDAKEKKEKKQKSKSKAVVSSPLQPSCAVSGKGVVGNDSHTAEAEPVESKNSPLSTAVVRPGTEDQRLKVANYIKTLESFSSKNLYKAFAEENTPIGYTTAEYAIDDLRAHGSTITAAGTKREDMSAKRLAFKMIEKTLKSLGISTEISKRCGEPTKGSYLMASPQAGPLLRRVFAGFLRGSSAHTVPSKGEHQLWGLGLASASQAEVLYFNVVAALQNFRQLHFKPSADLQPNEINLLAALSEHLAALTLIQRRTLHTSAGGLASCAAYCASLAALTRTDAPRTIPEQHKLRETWDILARVAQKAESGADDARRTLRAAALPEPGSALTELSSLAGRVLATAPAIAATPLLTAEHESQAKAYLENFAGALAALHTTVDSSQKVVLSALQATYAECADAITAARTTFEASRVNCDGNNSNNNNSSSHVSDDDKEVGAQFNKLFSIVVSHLLVPVQKMRDICEPLLKEECKVQFTDCHDMYKACLEATDCNTLVQCLSRLTAFVGEYCSRAGEARNEAVVTAMHALLGSLHGLLHQFLHSMGMVLALATCFHAELLKIFSTALGIFTTLYTRGWNMVVEDDSKQPPQEGKMEFADGTGMGEGEGEKDVSDQIEDSGQLNTGGNDEQPEDQQKQPEDPDKGFDMGDEDFDGSIQDVPQPTEEEKEKEEEEKDENEVDDDEKQMGQVDDDLSEKIDRKFWEGEDEEEKDLREELEKGDAPKTLDENEMEAQDDEDENSDKEDKKDKKDKKKEDRKSAPNPTEPPQEDDKDEENNEVENEEGEFIDEEEDEKESDPFNKNPENQPLDNEDEDEDENKDDGFAEDMELDKDSGDDNDDEDDEGNDEDGKKPEDLGNPDGSDLSEDELDENDFEQKDKGNDDLEEPESNDNNEENDDEDKNDDEINNNNENENDKTDQQEHNKEDQVFGVNDMDGNASESNQMEVEPTEDQEQPPDNEDEDENKMNRNRASGQSDKGEYQEMDSAARANRPPPQANLPRPEPAPYRKPSEALKKWKKRLQLVDFQIEPKKRDDKNGEEQQRNENEEEEVDENNEFAKTDENDNSKGSESTIAPVKETDDFELPDAHDDDEDDDENKATKDVEKDVQEDEEDKKGEEEDEKDELHAPQSVKQQPQLRMADDVDDDDVDLKEKEKKDDEKEEDEESKDDANDEDTEMAENISSVGSLPTASSVPPPSLDDMSTELGEYYIARETEGSGDTESDGGKAIDLWTRCQSSVARLSEELCEQLRIILEPTLATQLKGDYRTGKRINMKKVIPYIASQFKKDKIWLRRTRPHKRHYQVLLAIDDSESMKQNHAGGTALEALALISAALTRLEVGDIGVLRFGAEPAIVHDFSQAFTDSDGARVVSQFTFSQGATDMGKLAQAIVRLFESNTAGSGSGGKLVEYQQIVFIISDGRFDFNKGGLKQWINEAQSRHMFIVFIVIDDPSQNNSITMVKKTIFQGNHIEVIPYMDTFPFPFYVVLRNIATLPDTLASALRQWFELLKNVD